MKTVFKEGMKVYDSVFFPKSEGKVVEIDKHINYERVIVQFDCWDYKLSYTEQGRLTSTRNEAAPTLSTSPYTFQGFEQKAPAPTYEEAEEWIRKEYEKGNNYLMLKDVLEALRKLVILRDYYNEGWQPDWKDDTKKKAVISIEGEDFKCNGNYSAKRVLTFKSPEIRDRFFEEQKELLEIAKPLL